MSKTIHELTGYQAVFYANTWTEHNDWFYTGNLYMGEQLQSLNFIFDTAFDQTAVEVTGCDNCGDTLFDTDSSSTFDFVTPLNEYTIYFGYDDVTSVSLFGNDAYDTICLTSMSNSCVDAIPFVAVLS